MELLQLQWDLLRVGAICGATDVYEKPAVDLDDEVTAGSNAMDAYVVEFFSLNNLASKKRIFSSKIDLVVQANRLLDLFELCLCFFFFFILVFYIDCFRLRIFRFVDVHVQVYLRIHYFDSGTNDMLAFFSVSSGAIDKTKYYQDDRFIMITTRVMKILSNKCRRARESISNTTEYTKHANKCHNDRLR